MTFDYEQLGYYPFNELIEKRNRMVLPNQETFYTIIGNLFPITLDKVPNDFHIRLAFQSTEESFIEKWCLYSYPMKNGSSFEIRSNPLSRPEDFRIILENYGFTTGRIEEDITIGKLKSYLQSFLPVHLKGMKATVSEKGNLLSIRSYHGINKSLDLYLLEQGHWFIYTPNHNPLNLDELTSVTKYLLEQYQLLSIFGQRQTNNH